MASYETDEEQLEAIKKWWEENGRAVLLGVAIGLGAIFGWRGWVSYEQGRAEEASQLYERTMQALDAGQAADVQQLGERLMTDFDDTPYAELAALARAKSAVGAGDLETARRNLEWAAAHARQPDVGLIARLRLARVLHGLAEHDAALGQLQAEFPGSYAAMVDELRGDILYAKGDLAGAASAYRQALQSPAVVDRSVLEMKINDLAGVAEADANS